MDATTLATPYNDLAIPVIMGPCFLITGTLALALFVLFFVAEAFRLQYAGINAALDPNAKKPAMAAFVWRSISILAGLIFLYKWSFLKMVTLCDYIFNAVDNSASWENFTGLLSSGSTNIPLLNVSVQQILYATSATILSVLDSLVFTIRFVILSLLYLLGPLAWVFAVSEIGTSSIKSWFRTTWEVSFWIAMYGVIKAAITPLGMYALTTLSTANSSSDAVMTTVSNAGSVTGVSVVFMVVIIFCVIEIPKFTGILFSGAHISSVSNAIGTAIGGFVLGRSVSVPKSASKLLKAAPGRIMGKATSAASGLMSRLRGGKTAGGGGTAASSASGGGSTDSDRTR